MSKRSTKQELNKDISVAKNATKVRPKVPGNCKMCNGKLVDTRTRNKHEMKEKWLQDAISKTDKSKSKGNHDSIPTSLLRSNLVEIQSMDTDSFRSLREDDTMIDSDHNQSDENSFI